MTRNTGNILVDGTHYSRGWSGVVLFSMIAFVASYATGLGNVPWQQGELFSLEGEAYDPSCGDALLTTTPVPVWVQCVALEPPSPPPPTGR
jgi:SP family myo-inositol transporter-like MFS transporter 13